MGRKKTPERAPDAPPVCTHCASLDLATAGWKNERRHYRCRDCKRYSYGVAVTRPAAPPCPACGGESRYIGVIDAVNGRYRYRCYACDRAHSDLKPYPTPPETPAAAETWDGYPIPAQPATPVCRACDGTDFSGLRPSGGKGLLTCRVCRAAAARGGLSCPYCGGACHRRGYAKDGAPRFHCPTCGRRNTGLFPTPARASEDGRCWKKIGIVLSPSAQIALAAYCQTHGRSEAQAVRAIFRRARSSAGFIVASVPRGGRRARPTEDTTPPERLDLRLPDLRAEAARRRCILPGGARTAETVYSERCMTVALDDQAYTGLLRTMRRRGLNHQEAARALLSEAHPLRQPFFAR